MTADPSTSDPSRSDLSTDPSTSDPGVTAGDERRADLSAAFGRPATATLRGLLPPRPRRRTEPAPAVALRVARGTPPAADAAVVPLAPRTPAPTETGPAETGAADTGPADTGPADTGAADTGPVDTAPADTGPTNTGPTNTEYSDTRLDEMPAPRPARRRKPVSGTGARTGNRRWGSVRVVSQEHVELLLLVALRRGPADGRALAEQLRVDSGGGLAPPPTTVARTLHHLARHGLVEAGTDTERRRYRLTESGIRIARARVRAWRSLRRAVDAVVDAAGET